MYTIPYHSFNEVEISRIQHRHKYYKVQLNRCPIMPREASVSLLAVGTTHSI